jgi:carboxypeptidase family protein
MNTLVLIGLALVVAGFVLLAVRFAPRVRRQFAATPVQPRTVADLVRLREQTGASGVQPTPSPTAPRRVVAAPVAAPPAARPHRPAPRVAPAAAAAQAPPPAFVPPPPRPTPVAGKVRRESAEPPSPPLDGDNSPWQRGARMAVGLGGGQPWREPPPPPAPLRIVPAAEQPDPVEAATHAAAEPDVATAPSPVRLVPTEPESRAVAHSEEPIDVPAADAPVEQTPVEPVEAQNTPASPEPEVKPQAVWIEPGAMAEQAPPASAEPAAPTPSGWDDVDAEDVPAGAVPDQFADERPAAVEAPDDDQTERRRSRQTPDELAAEQAAADLALLRTFGFADPGLRPDSAPVVAMERPDEQEPPSEAGDAQPVRYRVIRRDGSVVGGATVTLLDDRGGDVAAGAADAEGRGEVVAPSPGGYVLVSTAAGHQPGAVAITVDRAATEADVLIARSASVSGSVHGEDGPIGGARVTLVQDGEAVDAADTAPDGTYRIGDIGAGEYGLSVAAPGCEPVATLLDVGEEADVRHDVQLRPASPVADSDLVEDDAMSGLR